MAKKNEDFGFIKQLFGLVNDQAELERLEAEKKAHEAQDEGKAQEPPKSPISLFSTIVGRTIAIVYGGVIVMLAMTGAALGLLVTMGMPSPLTTAIISGCVSAYINVTAFWKAAPQLIEDIFVTGIIFKKITNGKDQKERISFWRMLALFLVTFLMAALAAGVAISSEINAMTMTGGALQALGIAGLFGLGGYIIPVLLCVGFMAYWVLYSNVASSVLRETNFMANIKQKLKYLFCIDKDPSLLLPGEKEENASLRVRAFIRLIIFLAVVAAIMFATGGFAIAGVGLFLGVLQVTGVTPAILANMILPAVATFIMGAWAASVNFKFITLIVVLLKYTANVYFSPLSGIESPGWRFTIGLIGTPVLLFILLAKALWGFLKAEARFGFEAFKEGWRVYKEGPGFSFHSVFESARLKSDYKPWSGVGNITYNLVAGAKNLLWNIPVATVTGVFFLLEPLPPIRFFVTSVLAGVNKFLAQNRNFLSLINAGNNAGLIGGGEAKPMQVFGVIVPGNAIKSVNVSGGWMTSAAFGFENETPKKIIGNKGTENAAPTEEQVKSKTSATTSPVLHQSPTNAAQGQRRHSVAMVQGIIPAGSHISVRDVSDTEYIPYMTQVSRLVTIKEQTYTVPGKVPVRATVYTDIKTNSTPQVSIAAAQACVVSAHVPGQKMNIDGDNKALVRDAFRVCIINHIDFNEQPNSAIAKAALQEARAGHFDPTIYKLQNYPKIQLKPSAQPNQS